MKGLVLKLGCRCAAGEVTWSDTSKPPSSVEDVLRGDLGFAVCESGHFWT